jgi:succinate dehydrogenase hydrophobic anchor subunit
MIKIVTGPLLVLVLGLHLVANHYLGTLASGLKSRADVIQYFQNPLIVGIEILFLITVVTHSLIGLHGILLDLNPSRALLRAVTWFHLLIGAAAIAYGIWLTFAIVGSAA